jgi:Uma2 family endonuclease
VPTARQRRYLSVDEYFVIEAMSDTRHEYIDGEVLAMAGGSPRHNQVVTNLVRVVGNALAGTGCRIFGSDQRIALPDGRYTYPDAIVFCGPLQLVAGRPATATNPVVLVEVLSESTRAYDRGEKLDAYKQIPGLREVLLVDPDPAAEVERWVCTDGRWERIPVDAPSFELSCVPVVVPLAALYADLDGLPAE